MRKLKSCARPLNLVLGAILARLMKWLALARLHPNMNRITRNIWIGGANNPRLITSKGFHAVLDLRTDDNTEYKTYLEDNGLTYLNIKIPESYGVSPNVLSNIAKWLVDRVQRDEKVLVHCKLGRGRAALATAAYMVLKGATPEETIKKLKDRRLVTFLNTQQREALQEFSNSVSSPKKSSSRRKIDNSETSKEESLGMYTFLNKRRLAQSAGNVFAALGCGDIIFNR